MTNISSAEACTRSQEKRNTWFHPGFYLCLMVPAGTKLFG
jgi:hypothetical protein